MFELDSKTSLTWLAFPVIAAVIYCGFYLRIKVKKNKIFRHRLIKYKASHHVHDKAHIKSESFYSCIALSRLARYKHFVNITNNIGSAFRKQRKQLKQSRSGLSADNWFGLNVFSFNQRRLLFNNSAENIMQIQNTTRRVSDISDTTTGDDQNSNCYSSTEDSINSTIGSSSSKKQQQQQVRQKRKQQQNQNNQKQKTALQQQRVSLNDITKSNVGNSKGKNNKNNKENICKDLLDEFPLKCKRKNVVETTDITTKNKKSLSKGSKHYLSITATDSSDSDNQNTTTAATIMYKPPAMTASAGAFTSNLRITAKPYIASMTFRAQQTPTLTYTQTHAQLQTTTTYLSATNTCVSTKVSKRHAMQFKKVVRKPILAIIKFSEHDLSVQLRTHILDTNLLRIFGFPVESAENEAGIEIYKCIPKPYMTNSGVQNMLRSKVINTNDGLCITAGEKGEAKMHNADSGQGSSPNSLDSDSSDLGDEEQPIATAVFYASDSSHNIHSYISSSSQSQSQSSNAYIGNNYGLFFSQQKQCVRCKRAFHVTESGEYLSFETCNYHTGKLFQMFNASTGAFVYLYNCCQGDINSTGCCYNAVHVWTGIVVGLNGPYYDFVQTRPRYGYDGQPAASKVYALDCEMSYTGRGLEATKVTVIGYDGQIVYEHFVRPFAAIVDYNTRFSGITPNDLITRPNHYVKTLPEVQHDLLQLFDADTILIGHSLDNDLRVLRIVHKNIVDTSVTFPHASGFPYRRALKHLTKTYLHRDIQTGESGHNSYEDSRACLDLMIWKIRQDMLV